MGRVEHPRLSAILLAFTTSKPSVRVSTRTVSKIMGFVIFAFGGILYFLISYDTKQMLHNDCCIKERNCQGESSVQIAGKPI